MNFQYLRSSGFVVACIFNTALCTTFSSSLSLPCQKYSCIRCITSGEKPFNALSKLTLTILDIHLLHGNGFQFIDELNEKSPNAKTAMYSPFDGAEERRQAQEKGVTHFISKPLNRDLIIKTVVNN